MSYGWFKAVVPLVSGLAIQRDGQSIDIVYPPGTPTLGATYITPANFDAVHWLRPVRAPGAPCWHYWISRLTPNLGSPVDLSTVDPMLRSMVAYAQSRGVLTLPSCEGHFFDPAQFERIYASLVADVPLVRAGALVLRDVETGKIYRPRLPNWTPPDKKQTAGIVRCFSGIGRIGFSFPEPYRARLFASHARPFAAEVTEEQRGDRIIVSVVVRGSDARDLQRKWQGVDAALRRAA